jgi:hypothetical protein
MVVALERISEVRNPAHGGLQRRRVARRGSLELAAY